MFSFFRKHRQVVFVAMVFCFIGLLFFGIGSSSLQPSSQDVILKVNGMKVRQIEFDRLRAQIVRQHENMTPDQAKKVNSDTLNELIRQEVFFQESQRYGIEVTDQELQYQLAAIPAFQKDGKFDPQSYMRTISQVYGGRLAEFEKNYKKDIAGRKLNQLISSSIHVTDMDLNEALERRLKVESDAKKRKELKENPESLRNELRNKDMNLVFGDWLQQLNSNLKVNITSDRFRQRLDSGS